MELFLIRHGETTAIANGIINGQTDSPLSVNGISAAQRTAEYFKGQHFDALYASSLGRAMHTARIIGSGFGLEPQPVDGLREQSYGWLEGLPSVLFEPEEGGFWPLRPFVRFAMQHSAEMGNAYLKRILSSFDQIVTENQARRIMLVVHWGVLCILERYLTGKDVTQWFEQVAWNYCGISEFHKNGTGWQVIRLDDNSHL